MQNKKHAIAEKLIGSSYESMDPNAKNVARHITERKHISKNTNVSQADSKTFGQEAADAVAKFGGSWLLSFCLGLCWCVGWC